jgi:adenine-specific DNA-methyltransferase
MNPPSLIEPQASFVEPVRPATLVEYIDLFRVQAYSRLVGTRRAELGQYFTPPQVARLMASMFSCRQEHISLLDAGAGVGTLFAAYVAQMCQQDERPKSIAITAYEIDSALINYLRATLEECAAVCRQIGIDFEYTIVQKDFITGAVEMLEGRTLFSQQPRQFNCAMLNPPYHKINSASETRHLLRTVGIETSNLYTAFVWLAAKMLEPNGELVAITPRSFCNGPYFRPFRTALLETMTLRRIHIFNSRTKAFEEDDVLQENIIFHAIKVSDKSQVEISSSAGPDDEDVTTRAVGYAQIVNPDDENAFIHIVPDELGFRIGQQMRDLDASLGTLGLSVSTGRVVDFRAKHLLRDMPGDNTAPLIYPGHFANGYVNWPNKNTRKPNALALKPGADDLLVPDGIYVLVKRFSSKEERRRIVAAIYDPRLIPNNFAGPVGFENHINYYHQEGGGLPIDLARGLCAFLNSTLVDQFFRQFNGHTQVNATDLRTLRYPSREKLVALGKRIDDLFPKQEVLDNIVREELITMPEHSSDPVTARKKIEEALEILRALNVPRAQQNERSALTLLSLLNVTAATPWSEAADPLRGITEMMDYFKEHYGVTYAPNTRETVRRQTVHQFVQLGLVIPNPDNYTRPINSPKTRYQIEPTTLKLIRSFGTDLWSKGLQAYIETVETLKQLHPKQREMQLIPVTLPSGEQVTLSPGGQNLLIKDVIEQFCPRFTPSGAVVYLGDAEQKLKGHELEYLQQLGIYIDEHGKMPDIIVHYTAKNWLILVEAVTSHGPMDLKRHNELKHLFKGSKAPLVFVTAFATRRAMVRYLVEIAWETEVWVADEPSHLIHFNGERFLGPYDQ